MKIPSGSGRVHPGDWRRMNAWMLGLAFWLGILGGLATPMAAGQTNRWDADIASFGRQDATNAPPPRPVLLVGSSSIRAWRTLKDDLPGQPVLNRGFGGSHLSDVNHHFDRVVAVYRPRCIVLYAGDNDVAEGKTPSRVAADFAEFRRRVREKVPDARCAFLAIKPSPRRVGVMPLQQEANRLVAEQVAGDPAWTFLDTFTPILDASGKPDAACFQGDQLHLNAEGYRRWIRVIRPWVEAGMTGR